MSFDRTSFSHHIESLCEEWARALDEHGFDAALVPAGTNSYYFADDQSPPFRPNPHFARWVPEPLTEDAVLLVRPGITPKLFFYQSVDFWYVPPSVPPWTDGVFDVEVYQESENQIEGIVAATRALTNIAYVGPDTELANNLVITTDDVGPFIDQLDYGRSFKTEFEIINMKGATEIGVRGHLAAHRAFLSGASEFDIHMAYLDASKQTESELPYPNIIALNEHAGTLHYQHYDRAAPKRIHSFLIDAGGKFNGYHSDITRTYSAIPGDDFDSLINALDEKQQALIGDIGLGLSYLDLHERMHHDIAELLVAFGFVTCSAEAAFDQRITDAFFPHGLGHLLGLQTHDVGGRLTARLAENTSPSDRFPNLRLNRQIEANQVFTVEPGIYFIPMLIDTVENPADINRDRVQSFVPFGGIRIEDNILATQDGHENLTRPVFDKALAH